MVCKCPHLMFTKGEELVSVKFAVKNKLKEKKKCLFFLTFEAKPICPCNPTSWLHSTLHSIPCVLQLNLFSSLLTITNHSRLTWSKTHHVTINWVLLEPQVDYLKQKRFTFVFRLTLHSIVFWMKIKLYFMLYMRFIFWYW